MKIFNLDNKPLIGVVHLPSLTKFFDEKGTLEELYNICFLDASTLENAGFDAILLENFFDSPFPKYEIDDARFLVMSLIVDRVKAKVKIPFGINILRNACVQALIMASVLKASFIRCNIWEGVYITDQGMIEGMASPVIQKARELRSEVKVLVDVHVKHASPLGDFNLIEAAKNALYRGSANAIILTGRETGKLIDLTKLKEFVKATNIKPLLGSGLTEENLELVFPYISGAIIGSSIKESDLSSPIDLEKAKKIMRIWNRQRTEKHD